MTVEEVKRLAHEECNRELTAAEAQEVLNECEEQGLLSDSELGRCRAVFRVT